MTTSRARTVDNVSVLTEGKCKICGTSDLTVFAHTAACRSCGVLLYWPYPKSDRQLVQAEGKPWPTEKVVEWYSESSFFNHSNFTNMLRFTMDESFKNRTLDILDYGGGGGQFALVCRSHFPDSTVYITDISDDSLLEAWKPLNIQIRFKDFANDQRKFDVIFLNDVFEHVSDPLFVLRQLAGKLKSRGRIFIDTPKQFWIYPLARRLSKTLYTKVLRGTVSPAHLQIWSRQSFELVVRESGLLLSRYEESSEYTMPADFYMKNMGIRNPLIRLAGRLFYRNARYLANNKIITVLELPQLGGHPVN
jgi:ubiquinone/menaquinone biosynthesis C-methylase UbiE